MNINYNNIKYNIIWNIFIYSKNKKVHFIIIRQKIIYINYKNLYYSIMQKIFYNQLFISQKKFDERRKSLTFLIGNNPEGNVSG